MKFRAAFGVVALTASVWAMSGPACSPSKTTDVDAKSGQADQITTTFTQSLYTPAGATLRADLKVTAQGTPRQHAAVTWRTDGDGVARTDTTYTDASGVAVYQWKIGTRLGASYSLRADVAENSNLYMTWQTTAEAPVNARLTVSPDTLRIDIGASNRLQSSLKDASGNDLTGQIVNWFSTNTAVATVDQTGNVTAVAAGNASVVGSAAGLSDTTTVIVRAIVTGVVVSPKTATVNVGSGTQLSATVTGAPATTVTWSSTAQTIATVDNTGRVTGVAAGTAKIIAAAGTKADTATITVNAVQTASVDLPLKSSLTIKKNKDGTTESFSDIIITGDHEETGDKELQGFVLFDISSLPATISGATISVGNVAAGNVGNPWALGGLYVERTDVPSLNEAAIGTASLPVMTMSQSSVVVDITPLVRAAKTAGSNSIWLRLRMANLGNNNNQIDYGQFSVSSMTVKY